LQKRERFRVDNRKKNSIATMKGKGGKGYEIIRGILKRDNPTSLIG